MDDDTPQVQVLSYGPADDEYHHDAMFGPTGEALQPYQVAISPGLAQKQGIKLGDWINVAGKDRQVADWSYLKPGEPTQNTVEIRDRGNVKETSPLTVLTPDEVAQKNLPALQKGAGTLPLLASAPGDIMAAPPLIPLNAPLDSSIPDVSALTPEAVQEGIASNPPEAEIAGPPTAAAIEAGSAEAEDNAEPTPEPTDTQVQPQGSEYVPPPVPDKRVPVTNRSPDGRYVYFSDGTIKDNARHVIYHTDPFGNVWMDGPGLKQPLKIKSAGTQKTQDEIFDQKAAEKGVLKSDYPNTPEGLADYKKAGKEVLGESTPRDIADAIESGQQPPSLQGLYRQAAPVRAELARRGYNLTNAMLDWQAAQKHITAMNSQQQLRLSQSITSSSAALDLIDDLASQWKAGQFPPLNKARMTLAMNGAFGNGAAASIATELNNQISLVTGELGQVLMGGQTPTEESIRLARKMLSSNWDEKVLKDNVDLTRKNLQIRLNSMRSVGAAGTEPGATFGPPQASATPSSTPAIPQKPSADAALGAAQRILQNSNDPATRARAQQVIDRINLLNQ